MSETWDDNGEEEMELEEEEELNDLPTVELSFGGGKHGAWDDRALIKAYDAALSEFNAHHPGPGTWLDKATAALAQGHPIPGDNTFGATTWSGLGGVDASSSSKNIVDAQRQSASRSKKQKTKANGQKAGPNPYISGGAAATVASAAVANGSTRAVSPAYAPHSPPGPSRPVRPARQPSHEVYDASFDLDPRAGARERTVPADTHARPGSSGHGSLMEPTGHVSTSEAMSLAMTAQYWAGYWMGVAQSKIDYSAGISTIQSAAGATSQAIEPLQAAAIAAERAGEIDESLEEPGVYDPSRPANLIVTQQQFGVPPARLKR